MRAALLLSVALLVLSVALLAGPALAQDRAETLADIQRQLATIKGEIDGLKRELETTGAAGLNIEGTSFPDRVIALESQLQTLTTQTERLSFRVESVAKDGGSRLEDLRFQLCELTEDCDIGALPDNGALGGDSTAPAGSPQPATTPDTGGPQLAVGEQGEFDRAKAALDAGNAAEAAQLFEAFVQSYPTGPLTLQAQLLQGQAMAASQNNAGAARAYLAAFSAAPNGPSASGALLGLGKSLGALGQTDEACLTLSEIAIRFPQASEIAEAQSAMAGLGCS